MKAYALAIAALAASVGVAAADPPSPASLPHAGSKGSGKLPGALTPAAPISTGWNLAHCYTSIWYTDGTNQYIFAYNSEGTYVYETNIEVLGDMLIDVCRQHNEYGFYVYNSAGNYEEVWNKWSD
jgi:hypothetical protein